MAAQLNWAKRSVNAVWKFLGQEPVFKSSSVAGSDSDFSGAASATVDAPANPLAAVRGSTSQSIDSADSSFTRIEQLLQAWPEPSTLVVQHQEEKKPEELQKMPTLKDRLAEFKGKELSDVDVEKIYSIIVEEIKNASKHVTTPNIIQNISKDLGPLNLTPEHLEKLLFKISESTDDTLALVHGTFKKIIIGYENNARLPNMCQEIVDAAELAKDSNDRSKLLDKIHLLIQEAIGNKRPVDAVRKALEKIRNEVKYKPKVRLDMQDLDNLLDKARRSVTVEIPDKVIEQIGNLQNKMFVWLNATSHDRGNMIEPVSTEQYAEMLEAIKQAKLAGVDKYFSAYMATLCYYMDHVVERDAIEGSTKIGIFSQEIKKLLVDESGKNFKKGLLLENDTNTLHAPKSTGELPTSSRDAVHLDDPVVAALIERTAAEAFSPRPTKAPKK